jgi:hypothetical protein
MFNGEVLMKWSRQQISVVTYTNDMMIMKIMSGRGNLYHNVGSTLWLGPGISHIHKV